MNAGFEFHQTARRRGPFIAVSFACTGLVVAYVFLDASLWVVGILGLFTLPAIVDLIKDPATGLHLTAQQLSWYSGRRHASVALEEIDRVRLDTRLDFSVRAAVILKTGRRIRLPFEATPPHQAFEDALQAHGIKTERHHFTLMQ